MRLGDLPTDVKEKKTYYREHLVQPGGADFPREKLLRLFEERGDAPAAKALQWKPRNFAMGAAGAALCLAGIWGFGTAGRVNGPNYNPFEAMPVGFAIVATDLSFTLAARGAPNPARAADLHNRKLQKALGIRSREGRFKPEFGRWWWRIPALALVGGAYYLGRWAP